MSKEYNVAVFIGRFQPFHNEHLNVLNQALELAETVLIVIGSHQVASDIKNPFSYEERVAMIQSTFPKPIVKDDITIRSFDENRIKFIPVRDYYYNENLWVTEVLQKTSEFIKPNYNVALVGAYKDSSSYYINLFPQWDFVPSKQRDFLNATDIRNKMFNRNEKVMDYNPYNITKFFDEIPDKSFSESIPGSVNQWLHDKYLYTHRYAQHVQEFNFIKDYKKKWELAPFPPTFVTVDSVVTCSGHVLVVERGINPGKGKLALPGGFLKQTEKLEDGAIRELKEETGIDLHKAYLKDHIKDSKVFDYPSRSLRGRTISHAFNIKLNDKGLPDLNAGDDANKAIWMSVADIYDNRSKFFEDHFFIIQYFLNRS